MALKFVDLPDRTPEDEARLEHALALGYAEHAPLAALSSSEIDVRRTFDPEWSGRWDALDLARFWATSPDVEEFMLDGEPRLSWAPSATNSDAGFNVASPSVFVVVRLDDPACWVFAVVLRRDPSSGTWKPAMSPLGYYAAAHAESSTLEAVPNSVIADHERRVLGLAERYAFTMHSVAFSPLQDSEDEAFGTAWSSWTRDGRGRAPRTDAELVALAVRYLALAATCPSPTRQLANQLSREPVAITKALAKARSRGLLGPAPSGRSGGSLTREGKLILQSLVSPYVD